MRRAIRGELGALVALLFSLSACATITAPVDTPEDDIAFETTLPPVVRVVASAAAAEYATDLASAYSEQSRTACQVTVTTSPGAWHLLETGGADLALVTREGSPVSEDATSEQGDRWQLTPLATDAVVVIVHASRAIDALPAGDLQDLFTGHVLEWGSLGIDGGRPEIVVQDDAATSRALFDRQVLGGESPGSAAVVVPHDKAAVEYVASHPDAIGYAASAALTSDVRPVAIEQDDQLGLRVGNAAGQMRHEIVLVTPVTMTIEVLQFKSLATDTTGERIAAQYFAGAR